MKKIVLILMLYACVNTTSHAAVWVNLHENNTSKLMLDKQSILQKGDLKKVWVKVEYKTPQKNAELVEKEFNLSKLLWFFDCDGQKAATSQVIQYFNDQIVYSAAIDSKNAEFIEPIPDSDMDISMHYVCSNKTTDTSKKPIPEIIKSSDDGNKNKDPSKLPGAEAKAETKTAPIKPQPVIEAVSAPAKVDVAAAKSVVGKPVSGKTIMPNWGYEEKEGPANWAKLSPEFALCETGRNQSPINVDGTIHAVLKPIKTLQKFPAKEILNNGHTVQVNFKEGNMLVLDSAPYQMKQVTFHAPSENTIHGESFPLEAHFLHADSNGNLTVISVMFKEGKANQGLSNLWAQLPMQQGVPVAVKSRVVPSDLMPQNPSYYRFSGSLTTPPCSEGVRWILMKMPMTASKEQIEALKKVVNHNNRPVQGLNGRVVLE